jgi:glyoxylate reductase
MSTPLPIALVTHTLPDGWLDKLEGHCRLIVGPQDTAALSPELESQLGEAEALYTLITIRVDEQILSKTPKLRVVSNMAVGVDNIDLDACTRRGIPVGHTPGVLTDGTADLAMTILLAAARRLVEANTDAREGRWTTWSPTAWLGADLHGATLGIVGMGKIGSAVATRALGFGMKIIYTDNNPNPQAEVNLDAIFLPLEELLEKSDFVSLHVPLTAETNGLIGEKELRAMKQSAILVNTARGPVVDTNALLTALRDGWIQAAALDVTDPEPLPPDHPLYQLPNCLIAPHIGSATLHTRRAMAELACENLLDALEGRRVTYCANPEVYG